MTQISILHRNNKQTKNLTRIITKKEKKLTTFFVLKTNHKFSRKLN